MGGEVREDEFLEGSVLGASFWRWWKRAWVGGEEGEAPAVKEDEQVPATADAKVPSMIPAQEFVYIAAVVPRPRPPRRPAKSKPIDIPTKKAASVPVFEVVAEDKRYWYQ